MIQQNNSLFKPIISSSLAGGLGYFSTLPLDYVKQHYQIGNKINLKKIGIRGLFRGGLIGSYSIMPQMCIKFTANDYLQRSTNWSPWINGFIAGYLDGSFLGPVLSLQSMKQMRSDYNYSEAIGKILRNPRQIISMSYPMAFRNALYTSVLFGGYRPLKNHNPFKIQNEFVNNLMVGSILNIPGSILCSPFDVLRANQVQLTLNKKKNTMIDVMQSIYRRDGIKGFYRGFGSFYLNFALRFPLTFAIYYELLNYDFLK